MQGNQRKTDTMYAASCQCSAVNTSLSCTIFKVLQLVQISEYESHITWQNDATKPGHLCFVNINRHSNMQERYYEKAQLETCWSQKINLAIEYLLFILQHTVHKKLPYTQNTYERYTTGD